MRRDIFAYMRYGGIWAERRWRGNHPSGGRHRVARRRARPRIAVVQRSKDDAWVLPRGKLKRDENPVTGARREAVEETGHRVEVHEFLGAITYRARGRPKVVQFWRMQAAARPSRDVMKDIVAVEWLPLAAAVRRLSYPLEKLFLRNVGRRILKRRAAQAARRNASARRKLAPSGKARTTTSAAHAASAAVAPLVCCQRAAILPQVLPKFNATATRRTNSERAIHRAFTRKVEPLRQDTLSLRARIAGNARIGRSMDTTKRTSRSAP